MFQGIYLSLSSESDVTFEHRLLAGIQVGEFASIEISQPNDEYRDGP